MQNGNVSIVEHLIKNDLQKFFSSSIDRYLKINQTKFLCFCFATKIIEVTSKRIFC